MELRVLKYFLMTAREENITRAAQALHVTQPTLSRQLMQLEEELGVKLFERSSHRIFLTEDGMLLKRRAQEITSLVDKTVGEIAHREEAITGEVSIGCGEIISMTCLARMQAEFRDRHPGVHYDIYSGNADSIKERIENGLLDLGLLLEPVDIANYEFVRMPKRESWGALVRRDSPLAGKAALRPADLVGVPLMMTQRTVVQNEVMNWLGGYGEKMEIVSTYNLMYNTAMMVKNGMGAAICLKSESRYEDLCFVPLDPALELSSVLAWKKNQVFSPATMAFIRYVKKTIRGLSDGEL